MQINPQTSLNGHNGPAKVTVSPHAAKPRQTVFLDDLPASNWRSFLHHLKVAQVVGTSLLRLITIIWIGATFLGLVGAFGGVWIGVLLLLALIAFYVQFFIQRRADFVRFAAQKSSEPIPTILPVQDKVAVYVTGECSVEGKHRRFSCLPGFYRTFATREHALLCQVKDRRIFGIASWDSAEVGLWYVFFHPATIRKIEIGNLFYSNQAMPTVAIHYLATVKVNKNGEAEKTAVQTVFVSTLDPSELERIVADLLVDAPKQEAAGVENRGF